MGSRAAVAADGECSRHDIPSLDGLRAVAIAIVILSHTKSILPQAIVNSGLFRYVIGGGLHGVQVFFVISGYLITTLLMREFDRARDVSLRRFYARRTLRIFPPFYVYLAVVTLLWIAGVHAEDASTMFSAATYTIIYHPHPQGWLVEHAWSLSIEEQFYLLWPVIFLIACRRRWAVRFAMIALAAMPLVRIFVVALSSPQGANHIRLMVNTSAIDMLVMGCLLALLAREDWWRQWSERWVTLWCTGVLAVAGLLLVPYAEAKLARTAIAGLLTATGYSVTALAIGGILEYLVRTPESLIGRLVNFRVMRHIGAISYSIYLWQQALTMDPTRFRLWTYPLILLVAEASFWLIERPLMRARGRFWSSVLYGPERAELTTPAARVSVSGVSPNASIQ